MPQGIRRGGSGGAVPDAANRPAAPCPAGAFDGDGAKRHYRTDDDGSENRKYQASADNLYALGDGLHT